MQLHKPEFSNQLTAWHWKLINTCKTGVIWTEHTLSASIIDSFSFIQEDKATNHWWEQKSPNVSIQVIISRVPVWLSKMGLHCYLNISRRQFYLEYMRSRTELLKLHHNHNHHSVHHSRRFIKQINTNLFLANQKNNFAGVHQPYFPHKLQHSNRVKDWLFPNKNLYMTYWRTFTESISCSQMRKTTITWMLNQIRLEITVPTQCHMLTNAKLVRKEGQLTARPHETLTPVSSKHKITVGEQRKGYWHVSSRDSVIQNGAWWRVVQVTSLTLKKSHQWAHHMGVLLSLHQAFPQSQSG